MQADILCSSSKGNCTLIRTKTTSLLIDCGSTKTYLKNTLQSLGQEIAAIDGVLITHAHSDHVSQLSLFADLPVYAWCSLKKAKHPVQIDQHSRFTIGDIQIETIDLSHDAGFTLGYILQAEGKKLVYVTDTGYFKASHLSKIRNADWYIFESNHDPEMLMETNRPVFLKQRILSVQGHLCNEEAALTLSQAIGEKTEKIVLAHLSLEANTPEMAVACLKEMLEKKGVAHTGIEITAAAPFAITHLETA